MSPNVGNFVHDLVEMARATEELPRIQASLEDANRLIDEQGKTIQSRELRIMVLKADLDEMRAKLRMAEVARDDAELRFLEADEVITGFRNLLNGFRANADEMIRATVKPSEAPAEFTSAPVLEPEVEKISSEPLPGWTNAGQSEAPSTVSASVTISPNVMEVQVASGLPTSVPSVSGQPDVTPQAGAGGGVTAEGGAQQLQTSPFVGGDIESTTAISGSAKSQESAPQASPFVGGASGSGSNGVPSTSAESKEPVASIRPYEGKYYINVPGMISLAEWLAGGGTEFTYYYRRA